MEVGSFRMKSEIRTCENRGYTDTSLMPIRAKERVTHPQGNSPIYITQVLGLGYWVWCWVFVCASVSMGVCVLRMWIGYRRTNYVLMYRPLLHLRISDCKEFCRGFRRHNCLRICEFVRDVHRSCTRVWHRPLPLYDTYARVTATLLCLAYRKKADRPFMNRSCVSSSAGISWSQLSGKV